MQEVLEFSYSADTDSILVRVSVVKPGGRAEDGHDPDAMVRQLGVPEPTARIPVDSLPLDHQVAFRALLTDIMPMVEQAHAALATDPKELASRAARLAHEEHEMARQKKVHEAEMAEKRAEMAKLDAAMTAARDALSSEVTEDIRPFEG